MTKNMLKLYEPDVEKKISILDVLETTIHPQEIQIISQRTSLSPLSVLKYIKNLQEDLDSLGIKQVRIRKKESKIQLMIDQMGEYQRLRNLLVQECPIVKIGVQLIMGYHLNRNQLMHDFFLSEAPLKRRLRTLKFFFRKYDLLLKSRKGMLFLEGDEAIIRKLGTEALADLYEATDWPFEKISEKEVEDELGQLISTVELESTLGRSLKLEFALQIMRIRNGNKIVTQPVFQLLYGLLDALKTTLKLNFKSFHLPEEEQIYLLAAILSHDDCFGEPIGRKFQELMARQPNSFGNKIEQVLAIFSEQVYKIPPQRLNEARQYISSMYIEKMTFLNWHGSLHRKELTVRSPNLTRKMIQFTYTLHENDPFFNPSQITPFVKGFSLLLGMLTDLSYFETPLALYIESPLSKIEEEDTKKLIKKAFGYFYKLDFVDQQKGADMILVLSRYSPRIIEEKVLEKTVYQGYVTAALSKRDMGMIHELIDRTFTEKLREMMHQEKELERRNIS